MSKEKDIKKEEQIEDQEVVSDEVSEPIDEISTDSDMIESIDDNKESDGPTDEKVVGELLPKTMKQAGKKGWYVIHTYAGYEEQVAQNLLQRIDSLSMKEKIFDVLVPKEKQIEIKNGKRRTVEKRIYPGYVFVEMIVTDDAWYVVRNTPNVTGFIGTGVQPTPVSADEIIRIKKRMGVDEPKYKIELVENDLVRINDGPLKGFEAKVTEVDEDKGKVKVSVSMFGRETPVTLDFLQIKKI